VRKTVEKAGGIEIGAGLCLEWPLKFVRECCG